MQKEFKDETSTKLKQWQYQISFPIGQMFTKLAAINCTWVFLNFCSKTCCCTSNYCSCLLSFEHFSVSEPVIATAVCFAQRQFSSAPPACSKHRQGGRKANIGKEARRPEKERQKGRKTEKRGKQPWVMASRSIMPSGWVKHKHNMTQHTKVFFSTVNLHLFHYPGWRVVLTASPRKCLL